MAEGFEFENTEVVESPQGSRIQHAGFKNALWIELQPIKVNYQTTAARGGQIVGEGRGPKFRFLAPISVQENVVHSWEAYESVQSRIASKIKQASKVWAETRGIVAGGAAAARDLKGFFAGKGEGTNLAGGGGFTTENIKRFLSKAAAGVTSRIPAYKIDTPLVYVDSNRREYNFTFTLVSSNNPKREVVDIVKDLMKYSAPDISDSSWIGIKLPWVFNLRTTPGSPPLFVVKHAALVAVQPTWQEPFIDGFPSRCELTLSFKDLSPLYRTTIDTGGIINVISPES